MNGGGNNATRARLKEVTLVCVDTTDRVALAQRAIQKSLEQADFADVKLFTHEDWRPNAVKIPRINGVQGYSEFVVRELWKHVNTSHMLIIQWDGYVLNGQAWTQDFLNYDYIGAPWWQWRIVGNGGFSLRSRRLMQHLAMNPYGDNVHPEDNYICVRHGPDLQKQGFRWPTIDVARRFAFEGRSYNGAEWSGVPIAWAGQFGFHSWLTPLPEKRDRPLVFHHSGDLGDVVYAMAVMKALGGGMLFLSEECKYPFPVAPRVVRDGAVRTQRGSWHANVISLAMAQEYVWQAYFTAGTPFSADLDFNEFRKFYKPNCPEGWRNIIDLHFMAAELEPDHSPWLTVPEKTVIPDRPIVVNRTARYRNDKFPWGGLVRKYHRQMVFVGDRAEWENFNGFGAPDLQIPYHETPNLLELAKVIAGAKVFIGNQSSAMAVALGLGQNVIQEVWQGNKNCRLKRDNAIYGEDANLDIPAEWLK